MIFQVIFVALKPALVVSTVGEQDLFEKLLARGQDPRIPALVRILRATIWLQSQDFEAPVGTNEPFFEIDWCRLVY